MGICLTFERSVAAKRKLFLTHAGELAHLLLRDVGRDGSVAQFVRSYAESYRRSGLLNDAARLPELESTIGREALLVMAADLRRHLSQEFHAGRKGALRPDEAAFLDAFYAEFLAAVIRGLKSSPADAANEAEMFRRDLEMYRRWGERPAPVAAAARADESQSPFRDRCALLLDPAMMEQARRGAAEFEKQLLLTAARRFRQLGRSSIVAARAGRRPTKKLRTRAKKSSRERKAPPHGKKKLARLARAKPAHRKSKPPRKKPTLSARKGSARH